MMTICNESRDSEGLVGGGGGESETLPGGRLGLLGRI